METNVSEAQSDVMACVALGTLLVELKIVSRILHTIRIHIGLVGTNVSEVQNSVMACVVAGTLPVEKKSASPILLFIRAFT